MLPRTDSGDRGKPFDWHGTLLLGPAVICLVLALNQVPVWGLDSPMIIFLIASSAVLMWLLVKQERASASPLVDLRPFRSAAFSYGAVAVVDFRGRPPRTVFATSLAA